MATHVLGECGRHLDSVAAEVLYPARHVNVMYLYIILLLYCKSALFDYNLDLMAMYVLGECGRHLDYVAGCCSAISSKTCQCYVFI
jgi:hypothetical protein